MWTSLPVPSDGRGLGVNRDRDHPGDRDQGERRPIDGRGGRGTKEERDVWSSSFSDTGVRTGSGRDGTVRGNGQSERPVSNPPTSGYIQFLSRSAWTLRSVSLRLSSRGHDSPPRQLPPRSTRWWGMDPTLLHKYLELHRLHSQLVHQKVPVVDKEKLLQLRLSSGDTTTEP